MYISTCRLHDFLTPQFSTGIWISLVNIEQFWFYTPKKRRVFGNHGKYRAFPKTAVNIEVFDTYTHIYTTITQFRKSRSEKQSFRPPGFGYKPVFARYLQRFCIPIKPKQFTIWGFRERYTHTKNTSGDPLFAPPVFAGTRFP